MTPALSLVMSDIDTATLNANPDHTTVLAAYLNAAMANDVMARIAYQLTYGVEWAPLGNGVAINDGATTSANTVS